MSSLYSHTRIKCNTCYISGEKMAKKKRVVSILEKPQPTKDEIDNEEHNNRLNKAIQLLAETCTMNDFTIGESFLASLYMSALMIKRCGMPYHKYKHDVEYVLKKLEFMWSRE